MPSAGDAGKQTCARCSSAVLVALAVVFIVIVLAAFYLLLYAHTVLLADAGASLCGSERCAAGATCTNTSHGYQCLCPHGYTGAACDIGPCSDYVMLDESWRAKSNLATGRESNCDSELKTAWYRLVLNGRDARMPSACPRPKSFFTCGTYVPIWYNGTMPAGVGEVVEGTGCGSWISDCCQWSLPISVVNCGLFFVYHLTSTPECNLAYCIDDSFN